jgi:L-ascorbate metabolism protein UlaG (beta-lactamase superfamily)
MIEPLLADEALLADIRAALAEQNRFHLWWLGQSGFLVQWQGRHLLLDPYLSDSLTRKYAGTDKPHVRLTRRAVDPARLDFIDVATSSHNHTDHLDAETLRPLLQANPKLELLVPRANVPFAAERLGTSPGRLAAIDAGETAELAGFTFHAVPAAHESVERDEQGCCRFLGYVVRFGPWAIYHSGDTVPYPGMAQQVLGGRGPAAGLDVAILPINGRAPQRRVAGNLTGAEAARLARQLGARLAIPCHYEMFAFNTATPDEFLAEAARIGQPCKVLRCGERWSSPGAG